MRINLVIITIIGTVLFACSSAKEIASTVNNSKEQTFSGSSQVELYSNNDKDTSIMEMEYQYFKFDETTGKALLPYQDSMNQKIVDYFMGITSFESLDTNVRISVKFFDNALNRFANYYRSDAYEANDPIWYFEASQSLNNEFNDFCQLTAWSWAYTGGAHGNGFSTFIQVDKKTGEELKLADFISDREQLDLIADTIFRKGYELTLEDDLSEKGYWFDKSKFRVNDTFYFEENKLIFVFNTYEIAPYSFGSAVVEIPLDKIKHLLKRQLYKNKN
ncbi:MAG: DUF3298 domain-containing protein [Fluviicola sp.]|nr:DUF3298 domain-containing protein [Fluviicola sp.]